MVKETPSVGRLLAMVAFAASCVGILLFLWLSFGGSVPLKPQSYRMKAEFPEAATLVAEADVRLAGVNVGKVKKKTLLKQGARTEVELEIKNAYAPIPKDSRAILRQKTLLGETYVELAPGNPKKGMLPDGGKLANNQVEGTVQLDEIFNAFDKPTRQAFQEWVRELAKATKGGRGQDLNDSFGNLEGFAVDGSQLLEQLSIQSTAVQRLIRNTGVVFGAINQRQGALRQLVINSNNTFQATASRDEALAETFRIFPTFLDESKATLARLETFSRRTRPLVNEFKPAADDLGPTVRDLGDLAPDLEGLFRDLNPLIRASRTGVPDLTRVLKGAEPLFESAHVFFPELNPILSLLNFNQDTVAMFITNGGANLNSKPGGQRVQTQVGIIDPKEAFKSLRTRAQNERGNAYPAPNYLPRALRLGTVESFECKPEGGELRDPVDGTMPGDPSKRPPCFVAPPSLYSGKKFNFLRKGQSPVKQKPQEADGAVPASPNR
jgi:phospholipid/cholesterol/gamma-HCH transport system substrate-binding protein